MLDTGFIRQAVAAPSAAVAFQGGRWSQQQHAHRDTPHRYPLVYGENVWVKDAPVISQRRLPDGRIERIQVLSVGQYDGDPGGWLGEVEAQIYDSCCRKVTGEVEIRLGKAKQPTIASAFYVACDDLCCDCPATGEGPVFSDTADRVQVGIDVLTEQDVISAWVVMADGVAIGTVWTSIPGSYRYSVSGASVVEMLPIPEAVAVAPQLKFVPEGADVTIGRFTGPLVAQNYPGVAATIADTAATYTAVLADIDGSCSGLAVVKSISACESIPTFKVIKGRQGRTLYAGGVVKSTLAEALALAITNATLPVGATLENTHTGKQWPITSPTTLPADAAFKRGDTYSIWKLDTIANLPEVYVDLVRSVGGGINELVSKYSLDYAYLQISADYCFAAGYKFNGVVRGQPLSYFLQNAAPQAGLIVTRRENRTGLYPADPQQTPTRVYTIANTNDQNIVWEPFDYHATDRLLIRYPAADKCGHKTLIVQDSKLKTQRLAIVEEPLTWDYVSETEQAVSLGIQYFNSIRFQRIACSFTATTPIYYLEPGEIFEFTTPIWEVAGEFSGRALEATSDGRLVPSWEPVIHQGLFKQMTDGNTITDDGIDFRLKVAVGDLVATVDRSTTALVTAVEEHALKLDGAIPANAGYQVFDLTLGDDYTLSWDAWNSSKQSGYNKVAAIPEWDATLKRVVYTGVGNIEPGAAVVLAERHWLWRCASIEPIGQGAFRVIGTVFYPGHHELIRTHLIT